MTAAPLPDTGFLIFDTESIPDGHLLHRTKYRHENLTPEEAIARAQAEARVASPTGSDFLPVTYQVPIAVCIAKVAPDFALQELKCLDAPQFRPPEITRRFWEGVAYYQGAGEHSPRVRAKLVTFNGRGFDLPLMEMAAFRYGVAAPHYFQGGKFTARNRYGDLHIDLMEFVTNFGACRMVGGLNLLSKLLGKPGKTDTTGDQVYALYRQGQVKGINDYCSFDVLDTYFVFLRTRVLTGELTLEREHELVAVAKTWVTGQAELQPHFRKYLENWGDWAPWP